MGRSRGIVTGIRYFWGCGRVGLCLTLRWSTRYDGVLCLERRSGGQKIRFDVQIVIVVVLEGSGFALGGGKRRRR